ncbi:MAG: glycosyltransferase [Alistipes sp.]|jgi:glycosyltransferase involved in cell wall biosynthesis|nr:glycosyltransferase [Alistipes sp.]
MDNLPPRKIILLGPAYPYRGGIATIIERLAREFAGRGARVEVLTFSVQYPEWLFPGRSQFREGPPPDDLRIVRCVNTVNPLNWWRVGRRIRREAPDFVVLKYWTPLMAPCFGTIARVAKWRGGRTKFLVQLDNVVPHERRWFDGPLTRYFVQAMDGFVCMSRQVEGELAEFSPPDDKPRVCSPHPIFDHFGARLGREEAAAQLGLDPGVRYILFFGLVRPYKGLDMLLEAFASLRRGGGVPTKMLVAGEFYDDVAKYRAQVERLGIGNEVVIHDRFVGDGEIPLWFSLADLLVLPYRSATQSGVTQIAMHFEVPMVVTDVGGLAETVRDGVTGFVADPTPESIAAAIERSLAPGTAEALRANFAEEKKRFSWSAAADAIEELYRATNHITA